MLLKLASVKTITSFSDDAFFDPDEEEEEELLPPFNLFLISFLV
jgi:hypothetical protein